METESEDNLLSRIEDLENRLAEAEQLIEAIKAGEVDAFALNKNNRPEIFTLQSGDYAYRVLVENFSEGALNLSEDGLIVYTNTSFHDILKLSYDSVISKNIYQFIHPDSRDTFKQLFRKGLAGQSKGEINLIAGTNIFPVYVSLTSLYPTLPTVGMIVTDMRERKEQEKTIKESEEKFSKLFENSPYGITLSDIQTGQIVDINSNFLEFTGYNREEVIGRTSLELNLADRKSRELFLQKLNNQGSIKNAETEIRLKSGKLIPVMVSTETITIGSRKYLLHAINDITGRKKAEEEIKEKNTELENMNKELEAFTYISSHDLQEPLRKIQTFAGRILDKEKQNLSETGKEYFLRIQDAASRMQTLIRDLLSFSRLATTERKFEIIDLNKIVDEIRGELKETIEIKKATIETNGLCKVSIIPFQFRQLIHNLISNALKFSKPDVPPRILIHSEIAKGQDLDNANLVPAKDYCHLTISDNGIGFEKRFSEKIFQVFQKLHGKEEYAGTGIGLAIVKKIIENHSGIITAESELGKGTTFNIYLPL